MASTTTTLLIGKFDNKVAEFIRSLRLAGGIVNRNIVIAKVTASFSGDITNSYCVETGIFVGSWYNVTFPYYMQL